MITRRRQPIFSSVSQRTVTSDLLSFPLTTFRCYDGFADHAPSQIEIKCM